jgi:hypothetical protein
VSYLLSYLLSLERSQDLGPCVVTRIQRMRKTSSDAENTISTALRNDDTVTRRYEVVDLV